MDAWARRLAVALGILLVVTFALSVAVGGIMGHGMMGPGMMGQDFTHGPSGWMWGAGMWVGGLLFLVFSGALVVGAVLLVRLLAGQPAVDGGAASPSALDVLKRRYAGGEITRDEYERVRKDLDL